MKIIIKKVRRYIPDDELIADLVNTARTLGTDTVSTRQYDRTGSFNSSTLITRFGSWSCAVLKAGLRPIKIQKPSKRMLLDNIIAVWQKLGRQPKLTEMTRRTGDFSRGPYFKQFGSWHNALVELEKYLHDTTPVSPPNLGGEHKLGVLTGPRGGTNRTPGIRLRMQVMKRDKFKCVLCGRTPAHDQRTTLEIDHIIPWSKGGQTTIDNLQTLCSECNNGKGDEAVES